MIYERILFEKMDDSLLSRLANHWGITLDDVNAIEPELHPDDTKEGLLISYTCLFKDDADETILNKIPNLQDGDSVSVNNWVVEDEHTVTSFIDPLDIPE